LALTSVKAQNPDPDAGVVPAEDASFAVIGIRVSGERANRVQWYGADKLSLASMWMLVAVTILSD
jgi:hypothetical protein